jgi:hypothetical protein
MDDQLHHKIAKTKNTLLLTYDSTLFVYEVFARESFTYSEVFVKESFVCKAFVCICVCVERERERERALGFCV